MFSKRDLTDEEIEELVEDTTGHWSDGVGGAAMDQFLEEIDPYYVELYDSDAPKVTTNA